MKYSSLALLFILSLLATNVQARTIEADVHGMTCDLCVDTLERAFNKMDSISSVEVSLEQNKIRLEAGADEPSIEAIKKAILDAGFTPVKVTVIENSE